MRSVPTDDEFEDLLGDVSDCAPRRLLRRGLALSRVPIPSYVSSDPMCRAFTPDGWEQFETVFAVLSEGAIAGLLAARERGGRLGFSSLRFLEEDTDTRRAFDVVDSLHGTRPGHEFRILDIAPLGAPYFWLEGPDPVFVDWAEVGTFTLPELSARLARLRRERYGD